METTDFSAIGPKWMGAEDKQYIALAVMKHTNKDIDWIVAQLNDCDGWELIPYFCVNKGEAGAIEAWLNNYVFA